MAKIIEFSSRPGASADFYNWISDSSNIAGTFLEGCTFDRVGYSDSGPYFDMITITKTSPVYQVFVIQSSGNYYNCGQQLKAVAYILSTDTSKALKWASDGNICWCTVNGLALCKNALFIRMYYTTDTYNSGEIPGANCYTCMLTVDEKGNFVFVRTIEDLTKFAGSNSSKHTIPPESNEFYMSTYDSEQIYTKPNVWVQQDVTSIYRAAIALSDGTTRLVPDLFISDMTQTATADYGQNYLYSVEIKRIRYLTNGVWYVKDE